jgi:hypothetical protein
LEDLEGSGLQRLQLLLRGVVGCLHCLALAGRVPQGSPRARKPQTKKKKVGSESSKGKSTSRKADGS